MIAIDTNVLLRLLLRDDEAHYDRAAALMKTHTGKATAVVCAVTLAEVIWVLSKLKKVPKPALIRTMKNLLSREQLHIPDAEALHLAIQRYRTGSADLPDYFIAELNAKEGGTPTYTFDEKAARSDLFELVP